MAIKRVWIVEGCISCNLCEDLCEEVFEVPPGEDSRTKKGYERHLGKADVEEKIEEAVDSCPVEVIKTEDA